MPPLCRWNPPAKLTTPASPGSEKGLESVLLECCLLLFQQSVSAGGPAAPGDTEPGETSLGSDEPAGTSNTKGKPSLPAGAH